MSQPQVFISYQRADETFARQVREHLVAHDVPCAPVYDLREVFADPQIVHLGLRATVERPDGPAFDTVTV